MRGRQVPRSAFCNVPPAGFPSQPHIMVASPSTFSIMIEQAGHRFMFGGRAASLMWCIGAGPAPGECGPAREKADETSFSVIGIYPGSCGWPRASAVRSPHCKASLCCVSDASQDEMPRHRPNYSRPIQQLPMLLQQRPRAGVDMLTRSGWSV